MVLISKMQSGLAAVILMRIYYLVQVAAETRVLVMGAQAVVEEIELQSEYIVREWPQELKSIHATVNIFYKLK